eukprot:TRINITY_DN13757_c0_g1_i1.p1 TRINITY_DN13757_c0_g1~~TRINITY_DN13757_c0_g1_i1.p1  ORF type:complete len:162 (-),score=25.35 TRINITY_DN13757_c0_g1_i1:20-454(-)
MDGIIRLWDLSSGKVQLSISNGNSVSCLKLKDSYILYSSSPEQEEIRLWDIRLPSKPAYSYSLSCGGSNGSCGVYYFDFDGSKFVGAAHSHVVVCPTTTSMYSRNNRSWSIPASVTDHESILFSSSLLVMATHFGVLVYNYDVK